MAGSGARGGRSSGQGWEVSGGVGEFELELE